MMFKNFSQYKRKFDSKIENVFGITLPNSWIFVGIWTVAILIFSVLTISHLHCLVRDYHEKPTVAYLQVVEKVELKDKPNLTICLPYYSDALSNVTRELYHKLVLGIPAPDDCQECDMLKDHFWDVWSNNPDLKNNLASFANGPEYYSLQHTGLLAVELMEKILKNDDFDILTLKNQLGYNWNQPLVDAVWYYFSCVYNRDLTVLTGDYYAWSMSCSEFNFTRLGKIDKRVTNRLFEYVIDSLETFFPTMENMAVKGKARLADKYRFTIFKDKFCFESDVNATGAEVFNFPTSDFDSWMWTVKNRVFEIFDDSTELYSMEEKIGPLVRMMWKDLDDRTQPRKFNFDYFVDTIVDKSSDDAECTNENVPKLCLFEKMFDDAVKICDCIPFALRRFKKDSSLPYCDGSIYGTCQEKLQKQIPVHHDACLRKCKHIFSQWKINSEMDESKNNGFGLEIRLSETPFMKFSIVEGNTFSEFLAMIGGALNLFLGLSGVTICAIVIFGVNLLKRWFWFWKTGNAEDTKAIVGAPTLNVPFGRNWTSSMDQAEMGKRTVCEACDILRDELKQVKDATLEMKKEMGEMKRKVG